MSAWMLGIGGSAAALAVLGLAALWDELREPHRDLRRPFVVVDRRTYRHAQRRIGRLLTTKDGFRHAYNGTVAICVWLNRQQHYGSVRRRRWMTEQLEKWKARRGEYFPGAEFELPARPDGDQT